MNQCPIFRVITRVLFGEQTFLDLRIVQIGTLPGMLRTDQKGHYMHGFFVFSNTFGQQVF
jgi:hypothetical protein